jgi:hypothetical protein
MISVFQLCRGGFETRPYALDEEKRRFSFCGITLEDIHGIDSGKNR